MKILLTLMAMLIIASPVQAEPLQMATFPMSRGVLWRLGKFGARLVKHTVVQTFKFAVHTQIIILDGITSTADVLVYDFKQHADNIADDMKYDYEALGIDGTNITPKVMPLNK